MESNVLLDVRSLRKDFEITKGLSRRRVGSIRAVNDVSFVLHKGETLGLVGESGCGKTTTGRCIVRAIEPTSGEVHYQSANGEMVNIPDLGKQEIRALRRDMRVIFQDPFSSLNPRMNVFRIISASLKVNGMVSSRKEAEERVGALLKEVGLNPDHMFRYPHAFSGGQRQRIAIARALISQPRLVIADEPVSALDVSVQAQVLNLLSQLKNEFDLTFLFIAHNLAVIEHMCDRIAVMYMGKIVELAGRDELFDDPKHPYTEALLSAIPVVDPTYKKTEIPLEGEIGDLLDPPTGCYFHPRCRYAQAKCSQEDPALNSVSSGTEDNPHFAACHFADELDLKKVDA